MFLLDASAVLTHLLNEEGKPEVSNYLRRDPAISTVNLAEVVLRLQRDQLTLPSTIDDLLAGGGMKVLPFLRRELRVLADLKVPATFGLSLGDRVCLATAVAHRCPVVTADRSWTKLKLPIEVICIR
ncbi:MAG: PIN domain-containing protein [Patescibacteria group bacterium]